MNSIKRLKKSQDDLFKNKMSIKSFISSYLPVQNTFETRVIQSLFSDGNIPNNTYFSQQNSFKLEFFDYVELEPTVDLESYIEQSFYSSISKATGTLKSIEIINNKIIGFFIYNNVNTFKLQDICSLLNNQSVSFIVKSLSKTKPKQLYFNENDYNQYLKESRKGNKKISIDLKEKIKSNYYIVTERNKFTNKITYKVFEIAKD